MSVSVGINYWFQDIICSYNKSDILKVKICVSFSFQYINRPKLAHNYRRCIFFISIQLGCFQGDNFKYDSILAVSISQEKFCVPRHAKFMIDLFDKYIDMF